MDGEYILRPSKFDIYQMKARAYIDSTIPHVTPRWISATVLALIYILRVTIWPGYYLISYALAIFILNGLLNFLTPKVNPAFEQGEDELQLPISDEEFRPFIRKLPEFHFWLSTFTAISIAFICSLIPFFDIPVFWPILVLYFIVLFFLTMKDRIEDMIKYNYLPFDFGKKRYNTANSSKKGAASSNNDNFANGQENFVSPTTF